MRWRLKSVASRVFAQPFVPGTSKKTLKLRITGFLVESTSDRWIPLIKGENVFSTYLPYVSIPSRRLLTKMRYLNIYLCGHVELKIIWLVSLRTSLTHLPCRKWPPFRRRYFQMHFREWKILYSYKSHIFVSSKPYGISTPPTIWVVVNTFTMVETPVIVWLLQPGSIISFYVITINCSHIVQRRYKASITDIVSKTYEQDSMSRGVIHNHFTSCFRISRIKKRY